MNKLKNVFLTIIVASVATMVSGLQVFGGGETGPAPTVYVTFHMNVKGFSPDQINEAGQFMGGLLAGSSLPEGSTKPALPSTTVLGGGVIQDKDVLGLKYKVGVFDPENLYFINRGSNVCSLKNIDKAELFKLSCSGIFPADKWDVEVEHTKDGQYIDVNIFINKK